MSALLRPAAAVLLFAVALSGACASASSSSLHPTPAGLGRLPFSDADVEFMSVCLLKSPFPLIALIWLAVETYASRPSCPLSSRSC
jgi:hypothetical protein